MSTAKVMKAMITGHGRAEVDAAVGTGSACACASPTSSISRAGASVQPASCVSPDAR